jgi:hypothetical protein
MPLLGKAMGARPDEPASVDVLKGSEVGAGLVLAEARELDEPLDWLFDRWRPKASARALLDPGEDGLFDVGLRLKPPLAVLLESALEGASAAAVGAGGGATANLYSSVYLAKGSAWPESSRLLGVAGFCALAPVLPAAPVELAEAFAGLPVAEGVAAESLDPSNKTSMVSISASWACSSSLSEEAS